jgi:hypothetical protein
MLLAPVQGATILADAFDDRSLDNSTNTASFASWDTMAGITAPATSLVFIGNGEFSATANLDFHNISGTIGVDYNLSNEGTWTTRIENISLDSGTSTISLTSLSLTLNATTNSGGAQSTNRNLQLNVQVVGSTSGSLGSVMVSQDEPGGGSGTTYSADLTGITLNASEIYDIILDVSSTFTSGVNASIDDFVLSGNITAIPEPSLAALIGLSGYVLLRRQRA